jgi:hypothetical protein
MPGTIGASATVSAEKKRVLATTGTGRRLAVVERLLVKVRATRRREELMIGIS